MAQINITGPYGGSPGGPHSIIHPNASFFHLGSDWCRGQDLSQVQEGEKT